MSNADLGTLQILGWCMMFIAGFMIGAVIVLMRHVWIESGKRAEQFRKLTHSPA